METFLIPEPVHSTDGNIVDIRCVKTSFLAEHFFWEPYCIWGPKSGRNSFSQIHEHGLLPLFVSCLIFLIPAYVHFHLGFGPSRSAESTSTIPIFYPASRREVKVSSVDKFLACAFCLVTISSMLCDAWWVQSNEVGRTYEGWLVQVVKEKVYHRDCFAHLGAALDRSIAALLVAPAALLFNLHLIWQNTSGMKREALKSFVQPKRSNLKTRRRTLHTICFIGYLGIGFIFGQIMHFYKQQSLCYVDTLLYKEHSMWHIQWHIILATAFASNRLFVIPKFMRDD